MILCPECSESLSDEIRDCNKCGWVFKKNNHVNIMLNKRDQNDPLYNRYMRNYQDISITDLHTPLLNNRYIEIQADKICNMLTSLKGKDVCDIGSGRGFLINKINTRQPNSLTAVDISMPYLLNINNEIHAFQANAENLPFMERFDIITCTDVMEHVINVGGLLFSLNRALRYNGYCVIRVPFKEDLLNYAPQKGCEYEFAHLRDFNKENIKGLLKYAGFKVLLSRVDCYSLQTPQQFWLKNQKRLDRYMLFQKFMRKRLPEDADVNKYPSALLRFFMKPLELTVLCKKIKNIY